MPNGSRSHRPHSQRRADRSQTKGAPRSSDAHETSAPLLSLLKRRETAADRATNRGRARVPNVSTRIFRSAAICGRVGATPELRISDACVVVCAGDSGPSSKSSQFESTKPIGFGGSAGYGSGRTSPIARRTLRTTPSINFGLSMPTGPRAKKSRSIVVISSQKITLLWRRPLERAGNGTRVGPT